jgi:signal transduction histidine kinase
MHLATGESLVTVQSGSRFFRLGLDLSSSHSVSSGSIFIVAEITQQKHAEEALLNSERLAATGRMAHTIAHEINNPLEAITNLLYLMQGSLDKSSKSGTAPEDRSWLPRKDQRVKLPSSRRPFVAQ